MSKRNWLAVLLAAVVVSLVFPFPCFAQMPDASFPWQTLAASALSFLVPVGIVLVSVAAVPTGRASRAGLGALLSAGIGVLAYWAVGFALQFGGIGLVRDVPSLYDLSWEWSLLDVTWGPGWGMAGLRGFFLTNGASEPHGLSLFFGHLPWVMTASVLPGLAFAARRRAWISYVLAGVAGGLLYPLFGNWVWGGGWLAHLGHTRDLGHGFVDFGGSTTLFLLAGSLGLAVLLLRRRAGSRGVESSTMPISHLPLLALTGLFFVMAGLPSWLLASPQGDWLGDAFPRALAVGILGCLAGSLASGLYTWFVSRKADLFMAARGGVAGAVATLAGAPFMPTWSGWGIGALVGLLLPLSVYFVDRVLKLDDESAVLSTFAMPGFIGTLAPGLLADGLFGAGWNAVGQGRFLGVDGLGVTGTLSHLGTVAGWEGQMYAQLTGASVALVCAFAIPWLFGRTVQGLLRSLWPAALEGPDGPNDGS